MYAKYQQEAAATGEVVVIKPEELKQSKMSYEIPMNIGDQGNFITEIVDSIAQNFEEVGQERLYVLNEDNLDDLGVQFVS